MTSHDTYLAARVERTDRGLGVVAQAYMDHGITEREKAKRPAGTTWMPGECPACNPRVLVCKRCDSRELLWIDEDVLTDAIAQAEDDVCYGPDRARDDDWDREMGL